MACFMLDLGEATLIMFPTYKQHDVLVPETSAGGCAKQSIRGHEGDTERAVRVG